ncbi:MAG: hypothetical protein WC606_04210 [Candidatus Absconditabacterales bacterium]
MSAQKKLLKFFIIIILAVFLLSTGLISVLYLGGKNTTNGTGDVLSGDIIDSEVITGDTIDSGVVALPTVTKEEASKKLQQTLSGLLTSEAKK